VRGLVAAAGVLAVALLAAITASGTPQPAHASFHLMRIHAVMAGFEGDDLVQYVELRMASGGQTQVGGKVLCFYAGAGFPFRRFTFPDDANNGASGSSILVGTAAMDAEWPHEPDFLFEGNTVSVPGGSPDALPVPWPGGKVAFGTDSAATPDEYCAAGFNEIDSVAYGSFGGTVDHGSAFPNDIPVDSATALVLTGDLCNPCARDNSADYSLLDTSEPANNPRNNSGQAAPVGLPDPLQGDADCDGDVDENDALVILGAAADLGAVPCPERADVNCDLAVDVLDALAIFLYRGGIVSPADGCIPIGDPLLF
jgi:hypothetical protein